MTPAIAGHHDEAFAGVIGAFRSHLVSTPYGGAALAIYVDGQLVVDVWGGMADVVRGRTWERNTLALAFSVSKSVTAITVLHLVEDELLTLDEPVGTYWPEFAEHGKAEITLRQVLAHRAGVPLVDAPLTREQVIDGGPVLRALEAQAPLWAPGGAHAYHAITVGHIAAEVVRRVTGRPFGEVFRERIADPLGLDVWIGLPPSEHARVALTLPSDPTTISYELVQALQTMNSEDPRPLRALTLNGALGIPVPGLVTENSMNDPAFWAAELPAANGIGTARSFAKLHAALVSNVGDGRADDSQGAEGPKVGLSVKTLDDATRVQTEGQPVLGPPLAAFPRWGTGLMLSSVVRPMLGPSSFGHDGAAGALVFADRDARVGFAFLPSVMGPIPEERVTPIVEELRRVLLSRQ
ncbi:CubicO group peptidase, beta-lactamase class C family [Nocardioides alpinus]|uniref:Class A beta-lactamase-related serine hydrolase n=2 Tax=Nocardioides TaxID=1839 RepID=A0A4Q2SML3_9ACTN|nr:MULTISPECIES: serine hydrolase domain-containing protein [Nocardioides]PKH38471.1 carboxylesterase [Nocardioides alpinus]RYC05390.1 class A beta-lactamase-related serine hydrolase [Nocardioides zhouii]SFB47995.1 CubicO group peptidase, beta-lactamase class C family [Nocardioides alpinus]